MKKKTLPLSQLLDSIVADSNPTPNIKGFQTIAQIIKTQEHTLPTLRLQLLNKLKSHPVRFIPSLEMFYCLCLMEYLAINVESFRVYIKDSDFVKAIEKMAQFDKLTGFFKSKPTLVQKKTMNLIQIMRTFPKMSNYDDLYKKYSSKGVKFPEADFTQVVGGFKPKSNLPDDIKKIVKEMNDFRELSNEPLKKSNLLRNGLMQTDHQLTVDKSFLSKAENILNRFNEEYTKYLTSSNPDNEVLDELKEQQRKFNHLIHAFKSEIKRIKKIEGKVNKEMDSKNLLFDKPIARLSEMPSEETAALMSPRAKCPQSQSTAINVNEIVNTTSSRFSLSRDGSSSVSGADTPSTGTTPSTPSQILNLFNSLNQDNDKNQKISSSYNHNENHSKQSQSLRCSGEFYFKMEK